MNNTNNLHCHYEVVGFYKKERNKDNPVQWDLEESTIISVEADSEEQALEKAEKMVNKKQYTVVKAWECFELHGIQAEMQMMQLEIQKAQLKGGIH